MHSLVESDLIHIEVSEKDTAIDLRDMRGVGRIDPVNRIEAWSSFQRWYTHTKDR